MDQSIGVNFISHLFTMQAEVNYEQKIVVLTVAVYLMDNSWYS